MQPNVVGVFPQTRNFLNPYRIDLGQNCYINKIKGTPAYSAFKFESHNVNDTLFHSQTKQKNYRKLVNGVCAKKSTIFRKVSVAKYRPSKTDREINFS